MADRPLPHWPRRMSSFLTANYLDISETKFLQDVNAGNTPSPSTMAGVSYGTGTRLTPLSIASSAPNATRL
jgi:hypothetical protein